MSTVSQVRPSPASKYETFVEEQLTRARHRIRLLDLAAAGHGILIVTLGYGLLMVVLDRLLELPSLVRQAAFGLYLVGAVVYVGFTLGRVLLRRINPLYAAQQVEHILPDAKNSVVNYLDLRGQDLPAAIRGAVSHRAAKDLARADLDQAISTRRTGWLGGIVGGLCLGLAILFFLGPPQFFSLLRRAFAPFTETTIATRTQLGIMQPEGGNCTVAVGRAVPVLVSVFGHIPESNRSDSLRLLYRHQPTDPYTERPLERGDSRNEWGTVVPAAEVQNGFWYKVAGGDAETPEYRVQVRSNPLVETIEVKYHFRPYLNRPDLTTNEPNLEALRGTEVTLTARTNRDIREGHLEFVGEALPLVAEKIAEDAHALRFKFTLDKDATYRIWFTSQEGERNGEPMPYSIRVKKDNPPRVEVTKLDPAPGQPAADKAAEAKDGEKVVELPANGLLKVEGVARDDYGVVGMKLRAEGDVQFARTYREGKSFQLENGNYPLKLDYKGFLDLSKLKMANGQPLRPGLEFECWLEATDNCDYPEANVGQSERFKVRIKDVEKDPQKQQQQRQKAQEEQKKHNEKQDQNLQKESQDRKQQQSEDKSKDNPQQEKEKQDGKGENGVDGQKKPEQSNEPKNSENTQPKNGNDGQSQQEGKQTDSKEGNSQGEQNKQLEEQEKRLKEALQQDEQEKSKGGQENQNGQGNRSGQEDKAAPPNNQEGKAGQQKKQGNTAGQQNHQENSPGQQNGQGTKAGPENKPGSQNSQESKAGQQKGQENQSGQQNDQGSKSGQQKDQENKPGQQNGQENRAGQNNKAGQQKSPENKAGQENKPGQQNGSGSKTGQQSGPENKAGQNNKAGQQNGQGNKPEQQNGQKNQAGQENKTGQQQGQGNKTGQENPAGQENKSGQQNGQENKAGQKNDQETRAGQENPAGQKGKGGQENKNDQENKAGQENKATQRNGQEGKGGQENKAGQQNGQGDKTGQQSKAGQQRAQENKSGQENKTGQPNGQTNQGNQQKGQETKAGQSNTKGGNKDQEKGAGNKNGNDRKPSIDELINALKNGNAKVRQDAAKKLEDAKERVTDPALKKAIEDALKESKEGKSGGEKAGQSGQKSEPNKGQQSPSEQGNGPKAKRPDQNAKPDGSEGKTGQPNGKGDKGEQKNGQAGKTGQPNGQSKQDGGMKGEGNKGDKGQSAGAPQGQSGEKPGNPGSTPGGGGARGNRRSPAANSPDPSIKSEANPLYQQKAGQLQLEYFKKHVTKDVIRKANMTEEEYLKFLQAYEEMLQRKQADPTAKDDKLANPKSRGGNLNSIGARRVEPKGKDDKVQRNGLALPPPEYRDAYKEFTEKLSDLERSGDKR